MARVVTHTASDGEIVAENKTKCEKRHSASQGLVCATGGGGRAPELTPTDEIMASASGGRGKLALYAMLCSGYTQCSGWPLAHIPHTNSIPNHKHLPQMPEPTLP